MAKYLDDTGLGRVWAKVLAKLQNYIPKSGGQLQYDATLTSYNETTKARLAPGGLDLYMSTTGGWARGINVYNSDGTTLYGGFSVYGNADNPSYCYIGESYNSQTATKFYPDGHVVLGGTASSSAEPTAGTHLTPKSYVDAQITETAKSYLPLAGGTVTGDLFLSKGYNVTSSMIGSGSDVSGFVKICTINLTHTFVDAPVVIEIAQRGRVDTSKLTVRFLNTSSLDPAVRSFCHTGSIAAYIYHADTSVYEIYVEKTSANDRIQVVDYTCTDYNKSRMTVTWDGKSQVSAIPDGAIQSTFAGVLGDTGWVAMANNASRVSSGTIQYRQYGKTFAIRGTRVTLASDLTVTSPAPQFLASTGVDFTGVTCAGIGRTYAGDTVYLTATKYSGDNILSAFAMGSSVAAGSTMDFVVTGFVD